MNPRLRRTINWIGLATPLGLAVAAAGRAEISRGPTGLRLATRWRGKHPRAMAFTIGDVIVTRMTAAELAQRPELLAHEMHHSSQWACWLGLPFLPTYGVASLWSLARTGDPASRNAFERRANLLAGGYHERPPRRWL